MSSVESVIGADDPLHEKQIPDWDQSQIHTKQIKLYKDKTHPNSSAWGDTLTTKDSGTIRIAFRNINSFPIHSKDTRNLEFISDIHNGCFDIYGITETNIAWNMLDRSTLPSERFRGKFEAAHWICSNNTQEAVSNKSLQQSGGTMMVCVSNKSLQQSGETMMVCVNKLCHRVLRSGKDKMGSWSWILLRGKDEHQLGVITMYRAVKSTGELSAYRQQQRTLEK